MQLKLPRLTPPPLKLQPEDLQSWVYVDEKGEPQTLADVIALNLDAPLSLANLKEADRQKIVLARLRANPDQRFLHWNFGEISATDLADRIAQNDPIGVAGQKYLERHIERLHQSVIPHRDGQALTAPCTPPVLPQGGSSSSQYAVAFMMTNETGAQVAGNAMRSLMNADPLYLRSGLTATHPLVGCTEVGQLSSVIAGQPCTGLITGCGHGVSTGFPMGDPAGVSCSVPVLYSDSSPEELQAIVAGRIVHLVACSTAIVLGKKIAACDGGQAKAFFGYNEVIFTDLYKVPQKVCFMHLINVALVQGATVQQARDYFTRCVHYEGCRPGGDPVLYSDLLDLDKQLKLICNDPSVTLSPCPSGPLAAGETDEITKGEGSDIV